MAISATRPAPASASTGPRFDAARFADLARRVAAPASRPRYTACSPLAGQELGELPLASAADVVEAAARARRAQEGWAQRTFAERAAVLLRVHDLVLERRDEALDLIQLEAGKARRHAFEEIGDSALVTRYYAVHGEGHLASRRRRGVLPGLTSVWEHRRPKGVVGMISPWNYPLTLSLSEAAPALLAGNAVVIKPDRQTSFTALWAGELLREAGLPEDLYQVVTGEGATLGPPLIDECDFISFTGSTATGKRVARQAGERLIACTLELGGKNPMLVLADADLERALPGAVRGCFSSAGQLCISFERIYVHLSLYHRFLERFAAETRGLRLGAGLDWEADMGSLVSAAQLRKVEEHVRDAVAKGATVDAGGRARPDLGPFFYEPTVLSGVTPEMTLFAEETFGPVAAVYPFESVNDAVERANASRYGLNASVWTRDVELGQRLAARLQVGTVNINDSYAATWGSTDAPMGGFKESGLGRRHGAEGILKFTEAQTVAVQRLVPVTTPPQVEPERFGRILSSTLKALRRVPGLR